jgi:hypothetical protein
VVLIAPDGLFPSKKRKESLAFELTIGSFRFVDGMIVHDQNLLSAESPFHAGQNLETNQLNRAFPQGLKAPRYPKTKMFGLKPVPFRRTLPVSFEMRCPLFGNYTK